MPGEGLSNIKIDGEKMLAIDDVLGMEKAREMAVDTKIKAFGMLAGLINRPKPEDIEIVYEEKRFEAFWRVSGASRFEYKRRKSYRVTVEPMVDDVEILGDVFKVSAQKTIDLEGTERCVEEYSEQSIVNAQDGQTEDFSRYLAYPNKPIGSTEELTKDGALVVELAAKPAFLVRKVVNALIKPIQADLILDEDIGIKELALYFIPVYTFEFHWKAKDKRMTVSFDGATGEQRKEANKIASRLRKSFSNDEIFEFSKEVANFVPGGGLAMMAGKKVVQLYNERKT